MTQRKAPRGRRPTGYGSEHRRLLSSGSVFFPDGIRDFYLGEDWQAGELNLEAIKTAWEELREELQPEWIEKHPGTRPWGWWAFDAPEPIRNLISGEPPPEHELRPCLGIWQESEQALPTTGPSPLDDLVWGGCSFGRPWWGSIRPWSTTPEFEGEPEYLSRLGLLEFEESQRLVEV
jgi:hypothetical protein